MRIIFLSERRCALSVNGLYLGLVDSFERAVELDLSQKHFVELKPEGRLPVRFCLDEAVLLDPPPHVTLYETRAGVALFVGDFLREETALRVLSQQRLGGALFTFTLQQRVQLLYEDGKNFHVVDLPDAFERCTVTEAGALYLLEGEGAFCLLTREGGVRLLSEGTVLERGRTVKAEIPFHDSMSHTALAEWTDGEMTACSIRTAREPCAATYALALFESACIGADCTPFLAPALLEKAGSLKQFLGGYTSAVLTGEEDVIGLVYPRRPRLFEVRYFKVALQDGKIANIFAL